MVKDLGACAICGEPAVRRLQRDWWGREPFCRACADWMTEAMAKERELLLRYAATLRARSTAEHPALLRDALRMARQLRTRDRDGWFRRRMYSLAACLHLQAGNTAEIVRLDRRRLRTGRLQPPEILTVEADLAHGLAQLGRGRPAARLIRAILTHGRAAWHDAVSAFFTLVRIAPEIPARHEAELREILLEGARRDRAGKRVLAAAARLPLRDAVLLVRQDLVRPHGSRGAKDRLTPPNRG